jgi:hypothetical protein
MWWDVLLGVTEWMSTDYVMVGEAVALYGSDQLGRLLKSMGLEIEGWGPEFDAMTPEASADRLVNHINVVYSVSRSVLDTVQFVEVLAADIRSKELQ